MKAIDKRFHVYVQIKFNAIIGTIFLQLSGRLNYQKELLFIKFFKNIIQIDVISNFQNSIF